MYLNMSKTSTGETLKQMALQDISKAGEEQVFTEITSETTTVLDALINKCNILYEKVNAFYSKKQTVKDNPTAQAALVESFSLLHMLRQLATQQKMILNFAFEENGLDGKKQLKKVEQDYESLISQDLITATKQGVYLRDKIKRLADEALIQRINTKTYDIQTAGTEDIISEGKVWEKIQTLTWFNLKGITRKAGTKVEKNFNKNLYGVYTSTQTENKPFFQRYYGGLAFNNGWLWEWFSEMVVRKQELLIDIYYAPDGKAIDLFFSADNVKRDNLKGLRGGDYQGATPYQQYQAKYQNQKLMSITDILTSLSTLQKLLSNAKTKKGRIKKDGIKQLQDMFLSSNVTEQFLEAQEKHLEEICRGLNQKINANLKIT